MLVRSPSNGASTLALALLVPCCSPPPAAAPEPPQNAAGPVAPEPGEELAPDAAPPDVAPPVAAPEAGPAPDANAPSFDQEMKCRREHCYVGGARHCFDTCYKYNHPRDPQAHTACDDTCRHNYGIVECEQACALDRRAFGQRVSSDGAECANELTHCRRDCTPGRVNVCELYCLSSLRRCEARIP